MLWLIKFLIFGHLCNWEQIAKPAHIERTNSRGLVCERTVVYICKCKTCGRISRFKVDL